MGNEHSQQLRIDIQSLPRRAIRDESRLYWYGCCLMSYGKTLTRTFRMH